MTEATAAAATGRRAPDDALEQSAATILTLDFEAVDAATVSAVERF